MFAGVDVVSDSSRK